MSLRVGRRGVSINPKYSSRACVEAPLPVCGMATKEEATKAKKGMKSRTKSTTSFLRQPTRRNFANVVIMARQAERSFVSELPKNKRSYHPAFPSKNSPYLSYPLDIVPRFSASVDPEYNIQKQSSCSNFKISGRQTSWNARFNFSSNSNFQVSPTTDKKYFEISSHFFLDPRTFTFPDFNFNRVGAPRDSCRQPCLPISIDRLLGHLSPRGGEKVRRALPLSGCCFVESRFEFASPRIFCN